jgi:hypothetical protein
MRSGLVTGALKKYFSHVLSMLAYPVRKIFTAGMPSSNRSANHIELNGLGIFSHHGHMQPDVAGLQSSDLKLPVRALHIHVHYIFNQFIHCFLFFVVSNFFVAKPGPVKLGCQKIKKAVSLFETASLAKDKYY